MSSPYARFLGCLRSVAYLLLPPLEVHSAGKKLREKSETTAEELESRDQRYTTWYLIGVAKLDDLIQTERDRASKLDDKATKITAVLAIALTIGSSFGKSIVDKVSTPELRISVQFGLFLSMMYIVLGGWLGLFSGISAKPQRGYGPDWEVQLSQDNSASKQPRIEALIHFETANLIRSNDISGALQCVRNGVIIFFAVMLLAVTDPLIPSLVHFFAIAKAWLHCSRLRQFLRALCR
jgi:hypothetical protein